MQRSYQRPFILVYHFGDRSFLTIAFKKYFVQCFPQAVPSRHQVTFSCLSYNYLRAAHSDGITEKGEQQSTQYKTKRFNRVYQSNEKGIIQHRCSSSRLSCLGDAGHLTKQTACCWHVISNVCIVCSTFSVYVTNEKMQRVNAQGLFRTANSYE